MIDSLFIKYICELNKIISECNVIKAGLYQVHAQLDSQQ